MAFANPYITCAACQKQVVQRTRDGRNYPCGDTADFDSSCLSWSPVDGCRCVQFLGQATPCPLPQRASA